MLRALIVEDSVNDTELLVHELHRAGFEVIHERVETQPAMEAALRNRPWDVVLSDFTLPSFGGAAAQQLLREEALEIPFIFVSATIGEETAVEAVKSGAYDYVLKDNLRRLAPAVERALAEAKRRRELQRAENALRLSEYKYRSLFEGMNDAALLVAVDSGRIIDANHQSELLFGWNRGELTGMNLSRLHAAETAEADCRRFIDPAQTGPPIYETEMLRRSGQRLPVVVSVSPLELQGRDVRLGIFHDITERKLIEEQLRQSQKMEAVGQVAGAVAHDFNNLLSVIADHAQALLRDAGLGAAQVDSAKQISTAASRAAELTQQLLAFSRKQVLHVRPVNLNDTITKLTAVLERLIGRDIGLEQQLAPELPLIQADDVMLEQLLLNLVRNARDAMPRGGRLVLRTDAVQLDQDDTRHNPEASAGDFVRLTVADTGCGIPPEVLPHIFEPFFTTKEVGQGAGLGLATVYGIARQHKGWVEVRTKPGVGTDLRVYWPVFPRESVAQIQHFEH